MAHRATIDELTEGLIASVIKHPLSRASTDALKQKSTKGFREHNFARTNQFIIHDRYDGLVEKFAVLNREDLSDALQERLGELPKESKWLPEILSLFLELSDRPVEKAKVEHVTSLAQVRTEAAALTWSQILSEDPLDEDGIWDDVDRGYHSSGDDVEDDGDLDSDDANSTRATSVDSEDYVLNARQYLVRPDAETLDCILELRQRLGETARTKAITSVSEVHLIREAIMMLRGLPTDLFTEYSPTQQITVRSISISTAGASTIHSILQQLADMGTMLSFLRRWISRDQKVPFMQSMQSASRRLVADLDLGLRDVETGFTTYAQLKVVSIVEVHSQVRGLGRPTICLARVIQDAMTSVVDSPFSVLDHLYDKVCSLQASADQQVSLALARVFIAGISTYFKRIYEWVVHGRLPGDSVQHFFVQARRESPDAGNSWHDHFSTRHDNAGKPLAPSALHTFTTQIFSLGKSQWFLKTLDQSRGGGLPRDDCTAALSLENLAGQLLLNPLVPFSQIFEDSVGSWLSTIEASRVHIIRTKILHEHGFANTLTALPYIFFGQDGTAFQTFADAILGSFYNGIRTWHSRFLLTRLLQDSLSQAPNININRLSTEITHDPNTVSPSMVNLLSTLSTTYTFTIPEQAITRSTHSTTHSRALALLLQTYHAKHSLRTQLFTLRRLTLSTSPHHLLKNALHLRHSLHTFITTLQSHISHSTSSIHSTLITQMLSAPDIDSMAAIWSTYTSRLDTALLLAPNLSPLHKALITVFEICERFAGLWEDISGSKSDSTASLPEKFEKSLRDMREEFDKTRSFLVAGLRALSRAGAEVVLEGLAEGLDWEGR